MCVISRVRESVFPNNELIASPADKAPSRSVLVGRNLVRFGRQAGKEETEGERAMRSPGGKRGLGESVTQHGAAVGERKVGGKGEEMQLRASFGTPVSFLLKT